MTGPSADVVMVARGPGRRSYPVLVSWGAYRGLIGYYADAPRCLVKGCTTPADYVRATMFPKRSRRPLQASPGQWARCALHAVLWKIQIATHLTTAEEVITYHAAVIAYDVKAETAYQQERIAAHAAATREARDREEREMTQAGRVLAMTGRLGEVYRLADGSFFAEMNDGTARPVCCWYQAQHVVDQRASGKVGVPPHEVTCPDIFARVAE